MDSEQGRQYLDKLHLLEPGEWEAMVSGERHTTVNWWIQIEINRLAERRILNQICLPTLQSAVSTMRAQANDLMLRLEQDKPFPYVALCGMLVKCNVLLMSTWKGINWAIWYYSLGGEVVRTPKLWLDMITLFAWNLSYTALYQLGYVLYNPFLDRRLDVPHEIIQETFAKLAVQLPEGEPYMPPYLKTRRRSENPAVGMDAMATRLQEMMSGGGKQGGKVE